jgi:hypothetical protein
MRVLSVATWALCAVLPLSAASQAHAGDEVELVRYMGTMQYMVHKAGLAIQGQDQALAGFYVHEIEEVIERLEEVESFDGHAIGSLVRSVLVPPFEALEEAVKSADWKDADTRFDQLLNSCNTCHETTEHGYIRIQRSTDNPFMQSFGSK